MLQSFVCHLHKYSLSKEQWQLGSYIPADGIMKHRMLSCYCGSDRYSMCNCFKWTTVDFSYLQSSAKLTDNPASVTPVDKPPCASSVNELSVSPAEEFPIVVECLPSLSWVNKPSPSPAEDVPTEVECPPSLSSVKELSMSPAIEVPTTVECLPSLCLVNELSPSPAKEVPTAVECLPSLLSMNELSLSPAEFHTHQVHWRVANFTVKKETYMSYSKSKLVHVLLKQTVDARNATHASKPSRYQ